MKLIIWYWNGDAMLLRKLEAYGFKSFADRLELEFGQGITAIVGPNGSGKSNITDAIRWVLGEQNIRNLRGSKSEDIIFAGSSGRRKMGVAEVSLTFDNSDGKLLLDFNEVTLTRRAYRSGESEYFINKSPCRLKDIHDLLANTGIGRDAMTVISQNKIDEVLNSRAEERRILFEEAAGIIRYKNRKKDALRKLESTEENLTRVADITAEIESQLLPLAESAARTTQYNQLYKELVACQVTLLVERLQTCNQFVESAELQKLAFDEQSLEVGTRLVSVETEKERITGQLSQIEEQLQSLFVKSNETKTGLEKVKGTIALCEEKQRQGKQTGERIDAEVLRVQEQKSRLDQKCIELAQVLEYKREKHLGLKTSLGQLTTIYENVLSSIQSEEGKRTKMQESTFSHLQELVSERNMLVSLERDITRNKLAKANYEKELTDFTAQMDAAKSQVQTLAGELEDLRTDAGNLEKEHGLAEASLKAQNREFEAVKVQEENVLRKVNDISSRLHILEGMQQHYEGFGRAIKGVLKSGAPWRKGICGAVAELLHVPEKYITAVEIALGGALQHIVTEHDGVAKEAIRFLKTQNLGRATFLPLNTIHTSKPRDNELAAVKNEGIYGFASDLVECQPQYRKVIEFLLGRTLVADTIDVALAIARKYSYSIRIVTLEGEILSPGGSIAGGSKGHREAGFLSRAGEIEALRQEYQKFNVTAADFRENKTKLQEHIAELQQQLAVVVECRQSNEVRQAERFVHLEQAQNNIDTLTLAVQTIEREIVANQNELKEYDKQVDTVKSEISNLENRDTLQKKEVANIQNTLTMLEQSKEALSSQLMEIKVSHNTLQQEIILDTTSYEQHQQDIVILNNQLQQFNEEKNGFVNENEQIHQQLQHCKLEYETMEKQQQEYEIERNSYYTEKLAQLAEMQNQEKVLKELRRKHTELQNKLHEADLLFTKYTYETQNCLEQLTSQFSVSLDEAKCLCVDQPKEILVPKIQSLQAEIETLGPVNPNAIDEHARLCERHQFMQTQYQDLIGAKEYLAAIIGDIDSTMERQFAEAYQNINEHFANTFSRLFGGGQAQLQLTDPEHLLETGIEIIVQPPGKKLQNLILLSGGERALTVIALLFAFLAHRPAPFSVVDEIDAPLDEANLGRFSSFLRDYSGNTQFIVVTHRKGTMEAADVMHGVTLEEAGVSRIVSVKLMDK